MKALIVFLMIYSITSLAQESVMEFDYDQEIKCHKELKVFGCINQKGEEVSECVRQLKDKLSRSCKNLHDARSKK